MDTLRRLKPDPENAPVWLREELQALADAAAALPPEARRAAMKAGLSPEARAYFAEQGRRALIAQRTLQEAHRLR